MVVLLPVLLDLYICQSGARRQECVRRGVCQDSRFVGLRNCYKSLLDSFNGHVGRCLDLIRMAEELLVLFQ